jgi:hypothetical protein
MTDQPTTSSASINGVMRANHLLSDHAGRREAAAPTRFVVTVHEHRTLALAGREGQSYTSPPQTEQQARTLAGLLAGTAVIGPGPWRHPIAGGQRTIELQPTA